MRDNTWTCHICGDTRPDAAIGVYTKRERLGDGPGAIPMTVNVRHCNDRQECIDEAPAKAAEWLSV